MSASDIVRLHSHLEHHRRHRPFRPRPRASHGSPCRSISRRSDPGTGTGNRGRHPCLARTRRSGRTNHRRRVQSRILSDLGITLSRRPGCPWCAYDLAAVHLGRFAAAVSSLPLLLRPSEDRGRLVLDVLGRLAPSAALAQFSYSPKPPVPASPAEFRLEGSGWIIMNMPPARVWTYRPLES